MRKENEEELEHRLSEMTARHRQELEDTVSKDSDIIKDHEELKQHKADLELKLKLQVRERFACN